MCLAIPARITEIKADRMAAVDILGVRRDISLDLTPKAEVGDYVLVHAGFAIEVVDEVYAQETIELVKQFPELALDDFPADEQLGMASGEANMASGQMSAPDSASSQSDSTPNQSSAMPDMTSNVQPSAPSAPGFVPAAFAAALSDDITTR